MPAIPSAVRPDPQLPEFAYNSVAGRYVSRSTGRFVSQEVIRGALDDVLDGLADDMRQLSESLRNGDISLADWQRGMMQNIKDTHLVSAAAQRGGWFHMTQSDFGRTGRIIRDEYAFMNDFAQQVASGEQRLDGTLVRRARLYGQAGRDTYYQFEQVERRTRGFQLVGSILTPADHCPECVSLDGAWYDIETLELVEGSGPATYVRIGNRQCLSNCRCRERYKVMDGEPETV